MTFLLDTNTCIEILNNRSSSVTSKLAATPRSQISLCSIVKASLYHGANKSMKREANLTLLAAFEAEFPYFSFDDKAAQLCGRVRADLERMGTPIGRYDLMIASIALANDLTLITHNTSEFSRVRDLHLEDGEAAEA